MRITESQLRRIIRQELMVEFAPSTGRTYDMKVLGPIIDPETFEDNVELMGVDPTTIKAELMALARTADVDPAMIEKYKNAYMKNKQINEVDTGEKFIAGIGVGGMLGGGAGAALNALGAFGGDISGFATRLDNILGSGVVDPSVIQQAVQNPQIPPGVFAAMLLGAALGALAIFVSEAV